jgi:alpha-tubulin suppressor-like RCC1 family protein
VAPRSGPRLDEGEKGAPARDANGFGSVAAGSKHRVALKTDGTLWAWGSNHHGQLGDGGGHKVVPAPMP